jgi:hypothetical protein
MHAPLPKPFDGIWYWASTLKVRGLESWQKEVSLFSTAFRPALQHSQLPIQWVPGVKQPEHETGQLPTSSAKVNNAWSYTFTPPLFHGVLLEHRENFTLHNTNLQQGCYQECSLLGYDAV